MKIKNCNSLEQVVAKEREGSEDEIAFNSLEVLELECLPIIKRFCSSNCVLNLPLLEKVVVQQCPRMGIFSVKDTSTPMLQEILPKEEDEKKNWEGDLNRTINKMFVDKVAFHSFKHLELSEYPELRELWYNHVQQEVYGNLNSLVIWKQNFKELVDFIEAAEAHIQHHRPACSIQRVLCPNLQIVIVDECPNLKYVFSPSLCHELRQLEKLHIKSCGVEKIVANEEGLEELKFHFPLLRVLRLINLRLLNHFYPKRYTLECPSLKKLNVSRCEALQIFAFEHLDSYQLKGICGDLPIQQALFHIEKVLENLEEISLTEKDVMRILNGNYEKKLFQRTEILRLQCFQETPMKFLNDVIQKFPATTTLQARCSYFKTLFPSEEIGHCSIQSPPHIKTLWLFQLEKLEHIWNDNSELDTLVPNLEHLGIYECCRLIRLAPPLTSFTNLITLEVEDCNGMMDFMSPFTAKSLVHLTHMTIRNCRMLEEVVMSNEGGPEEEIIFKSLKYLELTCLPRSKSFCFGKHSFIFPSLVTLKVTGCHKMQNFSSGITMAPFLKLVEVENGKKHWKRDLNTTISHLFLEKINENLNMDTIEASSSKEQVGESKPNQIVDIGKQDKQKNEASSGTERPLAQVTQNAYNPSTNQETELIGLAKGTQEMSENIERPLVEAAKVIGVYDAVTGIQVTHETIDQMPSVQPPQKHIESYHNLEKANETIEKPLIQIAQEAQRPAVGQDIEGSNESKACPGENLFNQPKTFVTNDKIETIGTQEIHDTINKPLIQTDKDAKKLATTQNTEESLDLHIETQKICDTINRPPIPTAQNVPNSNMIREAGIGKQDTQKNEGSSELIGLARGTQEMSENIEKPSVEDAKVIGVYNASTKKPLIQIAPEALRPAAVQDIEGSNESKACPGENLFNQPKTFVTNDKIETIGTQEIHDTIDKPLIQTDQDAEKLATTQNKEESRDLHIETQKICDTINRPPIPTAQNVPNSNMICEAAIDPSPSQAPEPTDSSMQKLNIYKNYKEMINIPEQNMPYLETGVNRHPQVLDWLNTKRRRVFTSSFFSLFADVTRILRTTRKVNLIEDDRNYIRECCTVLEGVGFDESWINYVHGCIEECGDGEDLKRKVEEAEGQASNLKDQIESMKKELASVEESLVLLRGKASKLHDFIES
ncbi:hypothetical protein K1719_016752 [Acacia pycnantha]|nr:hypothetical protein K1719_016752 [Acacia pycnantha]